MTEPAEKEWVFGHLHLSLGWNGIKSWYFGIGFAFYKFTNLSVHVGPAWFDVAYRRGPLNG